MRLSGGFWVFCAHHFTNRSGFFFILIYKIFLKRIRATTITTATASHWRTGCQVPGWALAWGVQTTPLRSLFQPHFIHREAEGQGNDTAGSLSLLQQWNRRAKLKCCSLRPHWPSGSLWREGYMTQLIHRPIWAISRLGAEFPSVLLESGAWLSSSQIRRTLKWLSSQRPASSVQMIFLRVNLGTSSPEKPS